MQPWTVVLEERALGFGRTEIVHCYSQGEYPERGAGVGSKAEAGRGIRVHSHHP